MPSTTGPVKWPARILVATDTLAEQAEIREILEESNLLVVTEAIGVQRAIDIVSETQFDLVITGLDAFDLIAWLVQLPSESRPAIISLSPPAHAGRRALLEQMGVPILSSPFQADADLRVVVQCFAASGGAAPNDDQ